MQLLLALLAMLASLLGLAGRDEAGVLPYAGGNAEPISSPEIIDYRNRQFDPSTGRFLQRDPVLQPLEGGGLTGCNNRAWVLRRRCAAVNEEETSDAQGR
jgi:hypothetical protein